MNKDIAVVVLDKMYGAKDMYEIVEAKVNWIVKEINLDQERALQLLVDLKKVEDKIQSVQHQRRIDEMKNIENKAGSYAIGQGALTNTSLL